MTQPKWLAVKPEILDEETKRKKAKLEETLMRAFERVPEESEPAIFKCPDCRDSGVQLMIVGRYDVGGERNGKPHHLWAEASPERPIARRCHCNVVKPKAAKPSRTGSVE